MSKPQNYMDMLDPRLLSRWQNVILFTSFLNVTVFSCV